MNSDKAFFQQWNIYQSVIKHNYMYHKEIIEILQNELLTKKNISVLDLGCGDSHIFKHSLSSNHSIEYLGIDSAFKALEYSQKNLSSIKGNIAHICGDFLEELSHLTKVYDVIIVGYSLHHLKEEEKEKFFTLIAPLLSKEGIFFFYDIYSYDKEPLEEYKNRACRVYQTTWKALSAYEITSILNHVKENDIPQSEIFYRNNLSKNGINHIEKKFLDKDKLFAVYIGTKI